MVAVVAFLQKKEKKKESNTKAANDNYTTEPTRKETRGNPPHKVREDLKLDSPFCSTHSSQAGYVFWRAAADKSEAIMAEATKLQ